MRLVHRPSTSCHCVYDLSDFCRLVTNKHWLLPTDVAGLQSIDLRTYRIAGASYVCAACYIVQRPPEMCSYDVECVHATSDVFTLSIVAST